MTSWMSGFVVLPLGLLARTPGPMGLRIWDILPRKSSLKDRARLASFVVLKDALWPPGPDPASGDGIGLSLSENMIILYQ